MRKQQAGASLIGWLIILVLIGFIALVGIRVTPIYMESFTVNSVVKRLAEGGEVSAKDKAGVVSAIMKRLDINDVEGVKRENIKLESVSGGLEVIVAYERRFPIVGNLDGVASFRSQTLIRD